MSKLQCLTNSQIQKKWLREIKLVRMILTNVIKGYDMTDYTSYLKMVKSSKLLKLNDDKLINELVSTEDPEDFLKISI